MKLRNKKTGEIGDLMGSERSCPYITIDIDFYDGNPRAFDFTSLAELNEEWEDYKPKEPLIKDPKIRKAVRAWAKACNLSSVLVYLPFLDRFLTLKSGSEFISFQVETPKELKFGKEYTITELCGEEE